MCWGERSGRVLGMEEWTCVGEGGVDVCWEWRSGRVLGREGGRGGHALRGVRLRLKERNRIVVLVGSKQLEEWSIRVK